MTDSSTGIPATPLKRQSWIPNSPSPLRNSFTKESYHASANSSDDDHEAGDDVDEDDEDEGTATPQLSSLSNLKKKCSFYN